MKLRMRKQPLCGAGLMALGLCLVGPVCRQGTAASAPAGFYRVDLLGNSDTIVSLPFTRPPAAAGVVASVASNVVTVSGNPVWTSNQFVYAPTVQSNTYFMSICSGDKEGFYYPILSNGVDSLMLQLGADTLTGLNAGDRVTMIPYWTLGTVFLGGQGVHASTSPFIRKTEVFIPNLTGTGINLSASKTYFYMGGHWKQVGQQAAVNDDDPLLPDAYFIVRHNVTTNTTLTLRGSAAMSKWVIPARANPAGNQDNMVALPRPAAVTLNASGLVESGAFRASPSPFIRIDQLFTFDNTVVGKNKSASATYFYSNQKWQRVGQAVDVGEDPVFAPGAGVIIRKGAGPGAAFWVNPPNY